MAKPSLTQWLRQPTLSWRLQIVAFRDPTRASCSLEQSRLVKLPSCAQVGTRRGMLSGRTVRSRIRWRSHMRPMRRTVAPAAPLGPCRRHCRNAVEEWARPASNLVLSEQEELFEVLDETVCVSTTGAQKHALCRSRAFTHRGRDRHPLRTKITHPSSWRSSPADVRGATRLGACKNLQHAR